MARSITYNLTTIEKNGTFVLSKDASYISQEYDFSSYKLVKLSPSNSWNDVDMNVFGDGTINVTTVSAIRVIYIQCSEPLAIRINYQNEIIVTDKFVFYGLVEFLEIKNYSDYDNTVLVEFSGSYEENSELYKFQVYNSMSGASFINTGATALSYVNLPKPKSGLDFTFNITDADGMRLIAPYDVVITDGVTITDEGGYIESTEILAVSEITFQSKSSWFTSNTGTWEFSGSGDTGLIQLISRTTVNLQTLTGQALYTVPASKILIVTDIVVRGFTATIDKDFTIGFNSATFNNVFATFTTFPVGFGVGSCFSLTTAGPAIGGSSAQQGYAMYAPHAEGVAADVLTFLMEGANTLTATAVIDVLGYLVDA